MAATGGANSTGSLQNTPTWALATVCFVFISFSIFIEHLIHLLSNWLKKKRKTALFQAVEELKSVLILLGFMSLILAVTQKYITKICVSNSVAYTMLPCRKSGIPKTTKALGFEHVWTDPFQKSWSVEGMLQHISRQPDRILATDTSTTTSSTASSDYCESKGMTSLISQEGINELSIFIFVLAVMQIVYSVLTMALGRAKMRRWKAWEKETQTVEYQAANDPNRFRFAKQTTFGRRHMTSYTTISAHVWIKCFFRQFFNSVAKVDYLTLRHGFITAHLSTIHSFDFQNYIERSLDDDFKAVVGISPVLWFLVVIFILIDVHGWYVYLWVSFIPLILVLAIGTKLQVIVARMALQLNDQHSVIRGAPLVKPNDNLFWFSDPKLVLTIIQYTLFMNAFELAFFVWVTLQFGMKSCYHERLEIIIIRAVLAVTVQVICSYITLPLYALVTQMGSQFKKAMLEEETTNVLKQWHAGVREKRKKQQDVSRSLHGNSSTIRTNTGTTSPDLSYSHPDRSPSFSTITVSPTEIVEDHQEIAQHEAAPARVAPNMVQIEMSEVTKPIS